MASRGLAGRPLSASWDGGDPPARERAISEAGGLGWHGPRSCHGCHTGSGSPRPVSRSVRGLGSQGPAWGALPQSPEGGPLPELLRPRTAHRLGAPGPRSHGGSPSSRGGWPCGPGALPPRPVLASGKRGASWALAGRRGEGPLVRRPQCQPRARGRLAGRDRRVWTADPPGGFPWQLKVRLELFVHSPLGCGPVPARDPFIK